MKYVLIAIASIISLSTALYAQQIRPGYTATFNDATTGDNEFSSGGSQRWTIDQGADNYAEDFYERPTNQTYVNTPNGIATESDYFGNLDIKHGYLGIDDDYLFVGIEMWDTSLHKSDGGIDQEGLKYHYSFRMSLAANGSSS